MYISIEGKIRIFRLEYVWDDYGYDSDIMESEQILEANPERILIGNSFSNMTDYSNMTDIDHSSECNSILLHISGNRYIFIGRDVFFFESLAYIIEFMSPTDNKNISEPCAIDIKGNYYLMLYKVCVKENINHNKIYDYFHQARLLVPNEGMVPTKQPIKSNFKGITEWWMGNQKWTLNYTVNPGEDYDILMGKFMGNEKKMYVKKMYQENLIELTKEDYINLMEQFGKEMGFMNLKYKTIVLFG